MCRFCKATTLGLPHGDDMAIVDGIKAFEPISVYIRRDMNLHIETQVDNLYGVVEIKYCPMCGRKLKGLWLNMIKHLLKLIFCRDYREATKTVKLANRLFADMMRTNKSVRRGWGSA